MGNWEEKGGEDQRRLQSFGRKVFKDGRGSIATLIVRWTCCAESRLSTLAQKVWPNCAMSEGVNSDTALPIRTLARTNRERGTEPSVIKPPSALLPCRLRERNVHSTDEWEIVEWRGKL